MATLKSGLSKPGLYFFPGCDMSKTMTKEQETAWIAK